MGRTKITKHRRKPRRLNGFTFLLMILTLVLFFMFPKNLEVQLLNEESEIAETLEETLEEISEETSEKPTVTQGYVDYVIDGDTAWIIIDEERVKVRFIGVNTPERGEVNYEAATMYTRASIESKTIYLEKDRSDVDRYGRKLRYIWLEKPKDGSLAERDAKLFNGMMLISGFAEVATYEPDTKYVDYFEALKENQ